MIEGTVVQFNENHKWRGCLGIITESKVIHTKDKDGVEGLDYRYMVAVPSPDGGTAYIFAMDSENSLEYIGAAVLVPRGSNDD